MVQHAVQAVEFAEDDVANCREAARFDQEFGQWHFVSFDGLIDEWLKKHSSDSMRLSFDL
jgi:hypothetical protein